MLKRLCLQNYVLFEDACLNLGTGLNVISGQTGAGKSLLAGALGLILGDRASSDVIRAGCDQARLSAVFQLKPGITKIIASHLPSGSAPNDGTLTLTRTLKRDGPSRFMVNGQTATLQTARSLRDHLMDMAAQNEHTRLTEPAYQRLMLDRFGRLQSDGEAFANLFGRAMSLQRRLEADDTEKLRVERQLREIRANLEELEALAFDLDSDPHIEERIQTLTHAESIRELSQKALQTLYEDDSSVIDLLSSLLRETESLACTAPQLVPALESLTQTSAQVEETSRAFSEILGMVEEDPQTLEDQISRAETLKQFARRFNCSVPELPEVTRQLETELEELGSWEADGAEVRKKLQILLQELAEAGQLLHTKRREAGDRLAAKVSRELIQLGMEQASFAVELQPLWTPDDGLEALLPQCNPGGLEETVFAIKPNPGEPASTLAETASGGEASRTMLAIKAALSRVHAPPVLFFDEIDTGIGSRLGDVVAEKLLALSAFCQVIAITHTPQIAAAGRTHLKVSKTTSRKRTSAHVTALLGDARLEEVTQMIRGKDSTETTRQQAAEILSRFLTD